MKLHKALSGLALVLVACGGTGSESVGDQTSANTADTCANVPSGPFAPVTIGQPFNGSEDFAFDGQGNIVAKRGNDLVRLGAASATPTTIASLPGQVYGLRFRPDGNLVAAIPGSGKLLTISPTGTVSTFATGLSSPNGVYVDFDNNTWVTEFGGATVARFAPDGTKSVLVSGSSAQGANGIVIDAAKRVLYYTEYQKGKIHSVALDTPSPTPILVATINGAALDGLTLDACGNVYAVDQGSSRLYRVRMTAAGAASPELLASFPKNVANAQFGSGPGFDENKLYVTGNPGTLFSLSVGVKGAPVPAPAR
jgi:sugar lactone lactonase YvrE